MARRHPHDPSYPYITAKHSQAGSHPLAHEYPEFGPEILTTLAPTASVVPQEKTPRDLPCPLLGSILPLLLYAPFKNAKPEQGVFTQKPNLAPVLAIKQRGF